MIALLTTRHRLSWISDTRQPRATTAREPAPWDTEVPLNRLAAAPFPNLVVSGAWDIAPLLAREIAGSAFASSATCWRRNFHPSEPSSAARQTIPNFSACDSTTASEPSWPLATAARRVRFMVGPALPEMVAKQTGARFTPSNGGSWDASAADEELRCMSNHLVNKALLRPIEPGVPQASLEPGSRIWMSATLTFSSVPKQIAERSIHPIEVETATWSKAGQLDWW